MKTINSRYRKVILTTMYLFALLLVIGISFVGCEPFTSSNENNPSSSFPTETWFSSSGESISTINSNTISVGGTEYTYTKDGDAISASTYRFRLFEDNEVICITNLGLHWSYGSVSVRDGTLSTNLIMMTSSTTIVCSLTLNEDGSYQYADHAVVANSHSGKYTLKNGVLILTGNYNLSKNSIKSYYYVDANHQFYFAAYLKNESKFVSTDCTIHYRDEQLIQRVIVPMGGTVTETPTPTKEHYVFVGWGYNGRIVHCPFDVSGNVTLYAYWDGVECYYTINGIKFSIKYGAKQTISPEEKEGNKFEGWYYGDTQITDDKGEMLQEWSYDAPIELTGKYSHVHTPIVDDAVSPTCINEGRTQGSHCSVCNEIIERQQSIPFAEHDYDENDYCRICGFLQDLRCSLNNSGTYYIGRYTGSKKTIVLPSKLHNIAIVAIDQNAFYDNHNIESVVVPFGIKTIGTNAFRDCSALNYIEIPDGLLGIGLHAFSGCGSLTTITLPSSITGIGNEAFWGCRNLKSLYFNGTLQQWQEAVQHFSTSWASVSFNQEHFTIYCTDGKGVYGSNGYDYSQYSANEQKHTTVTFDMQLGTSGTQTVIAEYNSEMPAAIAPTRKGYDFNGYYEQENGQGTQYYDRSMTSKHIWDKETDTTLYAYFTAKQLSVTLNTQTENEPITLIAEYDSEMPAAIAPTKEGYTFIGYFLQENGQGTQYYDSAMESVHKWDGEQSTILYAYYTPVEYTIFFDFNGGTCTQQPVTIVYMDQLPALTLIPQREGCEFLGYFDSLSDGTMYYDSDLTRLDVWTNLESITLYARWSIDLSFTVTWKNFDGTILEKDTDVIYGTTPSYDSISPERKADVNYSYRWIGWDSDITQVYTDIIYTAVFDCVDFNSLESKTILMSRTNNKPSTISMFNIIDSDNNSYSFESTGSSSFTNGFITLNNNGFLFNTTAINGITSIRISFVGALTISYGWYYNDSIQYEVYEEPLTSGSTYCFRNNDKPSYIKILSSTSSNITQIEINYKGVSSFNRYEDDNNKCANTDKWLSYGYTNESAYVTSTLKSGAITDKDVRIRHWYNGRPVTTINTVSYVSHSGILFSGSTNTTTNYKVTVNRAPFAATATSIYIPNTITSLSDYIFYGFTGTMYLEFESKEKGTETCAFSQYWNITTYEYRPTGLGIFNRSGRPNYFNVKYGEKVTDSGYKYFVSNDNTVTIYGYNGTNTNITIPNEIDNFSKIIIKERSFSGKSITSVVIPSNVIQIGTSAFSGCKSLVQADLSQYMYSLTSGVFSGCTNLESVIINETITTLSSSLFYGCTNLVSIRYNNSTLTTIEGGAFYNCANLESFDFTNLSTIGDQAFMGTGIKQVILGSNLTKLGNKAFQDCTSLTRVDLSSTSLTAINQYTFSGCNNLTSITFNESITDIGEYAFNYCTKLEEIDLANIINIGNYAFTGSGVQNAIFGTNLTLLGNYAFQNCRSLITVDLSKSMITNIPHYVFSGCSNLVSILFNEIITEIGSEAFSNCSKLTSIIIPDSVTNIQSYAFKGCAALRIVVIGRGLIGKTLSSYSFYNTPCLSDVVFFYGSVEEWNSITITGTFKYVNYYSERNPTDEDITKLPEGSLYWYYDNGAPILW